MERGVVIGGLLISGSFLLAVFFNHSATQSGGSGANLNQNLNHAEKPKPVVPERILAAPPPCCEPEEPCETGQLTPADEECPDSAKAGVVK
jgi:hypothetical protein